ncbi:MAG TPA: hypothetical protein VHE59_10495 [Mucilaginibacter sp.]|nr:hypothetical protein [Mucilaginibacter sp.]
MDGAKRSWKAEREAEVEKIKTLLRVEIGITDISESGAAWLQNLDKKGRLKLIKLLEETV